MGAGICQCETGKFRKNEKSFEIEIIFEIIKDTRVVSATSVLETILLTTIWTAKCVTKLAKNATGQLMPIAKFAQKVFLSFYKIINEK